MTTKLQDCGDETCMKVKPRATITPRPTRLGYCSYCWSVLKTEKLINGIPETDYCKDCGQTSWLCICAPMCGDCLRPFNVCEHEEIYLKTGAKK